MDKNIEEISFYNAQLDRLKRSLIETPKDDLVELLLDLFKTYDNVSYDLVLRFANDDELLEISLNIMKSYIDAEMENDVLPRENIKRAITGAELVLICSKRLKEQGRLEKAIEISMGLLSLFVPLLDISEDGDNIISYLIDRTIIHVKNCVKSAVSQKYSLKRILNIYRIIITETIKDYFYKWIDWRCDLLDCCILLCHEEDIRTSLVNTIERLILSGQSNRWHKILVESELKKLIFKIYNEFCSKEEGIKYAENNDEYSYFKLIAIEAALESKQFEKVIYLGNKKAEPIGRDISEEVAISLYQAYENLEDFESQRKMAENFLLQGKLEYYTIFKKLSSEKEWNTTFTLILDLFFEEGAYSKNYVNLILLEKRYDLLLNAASKNHKVLVDNIETIFNYNKEDANSMLLKHLESMENHLKYRRKYEDVIALIKCFYIVGEKNKAFDLIKSYKARYSKDIVFLNHIYQLENQLMKEANEELKELGNFSKGEETNATDKNTQGSRVIDLPFK